MIRLRRGIMNSQVVHSKWIGTTNLSISSVTSTHRKQGRTGKVTQSDQISSRLVSNPNTKLKWVDIKKHLLKCSKTQMPAKIEYQDSEYEKTGDMIRKMASNSLVEQLSTSKFSNEKKSKKLKKWHATATTKFNTFNSVFKSFTEASESIREHDKALKTFHYVNDKLGTEILDISSYHSILKCVARIGNLEELRNIWSVMVEKAKLVPDVLSLVSERLSCSDPFLDSLVLLNSSCKNR